MYRGRCRAATRRVGADLRHEHLSLPRVCRGPHPARLRPAIGRIGPASVEQAGKEWLAQRGIHDPRIDFLGDHRDEIVAHFGKPENPKSDYCEYAFGKGFQADILSRLCGSCGFVLSFVSPDKLAELRENWQHFSKPD